MFAALDWREKIIGLLALLGLIGGALWVVRYTVQFWAWVMRQIRPDPPRVDFEFSGGA